MLSNLLAIVMLVIDSIKTATWLTNIILVVMSRPDICPKFYFSSGSDKGTNLTSGVEE
jgi:hypothetical protein